MKWIRVVIAAIWVAGAAQASEEERATFDFGPFVSRQYDANGDLRLKVLGPFFEAAETPQGDSFWGVRPLYATALDAEAERRIHDIVWPVASAKKFRDDASWRFLVAYGQKFDTTNPNSRYRFWILPFYFQGRDAEGENYAALFPIGGRIHEILGRDRISFLLFPVFAKSNVNEVKTTDYLWPIVSRTKGKGIYRFRVFPFYGQAEHRDRFSKKFIMWPFWTSSEWNYESSSGKGYVLFPLWGHIKLTDQESWLFLPPFFRFHKGERVNSGYCPWPFIQYANGEVEKLWIWPLWGQRRTPNVKSSFLLWPIFWRQKVAGDDYITRYFTAMPLVYSETKKSREENQDGDKEVMERYHKLWPLISYRREGDASRLRMLELWPRKDSGPIERSWAPIWTLFSKTAVGDSTDTEFLWGIYRSSRRGQKERYNSLFPLFAWKRDDREEETREWSILKGLIGYKREGSAKSLRLLYLLRFGGKEKELEAPVDMELGEASLEAPEQGTANSEQGTVQ